MTCPHPDILAALHAHQGHCEPPTSDFPIIDDPDHDTGWASDRECDEAADRAHAARDLWDVS